jgi:hypothetical protein
MKPYDVSIDYQNHLNSAAESLQRALELLSANGRGTEKSGPEDVWQAGELYRLRRAVDSLAIRERDRRRGGQFDLLADGTTYGTAKLPQEPLNDLAAERGAE